METDMSLLGPPYPERVFIHVGGPRDGKEYVTGPSERYPPWIRYAVHPYPENPRRIRWDTYRFDHEKLELIFVKSKEGELRND